MNRICALLLVVILLCATLLVGCSKDDKKQQPSTDATTAATDPTTTTAPTDGTEPTDSSEHTVSTEPSDPSDITEPTTPSEPSDITEPSESTGTTENPTDDTLVTEPVGDAVYKVILTDGVGNPYTQKVKVRFVQDGAQIAMAIVNADGVAEKTLPMGEYDIQIESFSSGVSFYYDAAAAKMTADITELQIVLAQETVDAQGEPIVSTEQIFAAGRDTHACYVNTGSTHLKLSAGERSYALFVPAEAGTYEFSVAGNHANIGIYGASVHFVMDHSTHEPVDNKITLSVQPSMIGSGETGTTVFVIGLDGAEGVTDAVLNIVRTGDPEWSFTEQPWTNYVPRQEITPFVMDPIAPGSALKTFDLTASSDAYQLVLNEEDGTYHLGSATGPRVYVQLGQSVEGISIMGMVGEIVIQNGVPMQTGSAPFRYSYNNGPDDFFKEDYTDAMRQYVTNRDKASGLYPLNEDLYYMLPLGIEQMGWCRPDTANYLFAGKENINNEIAWMFLLVYEGSGGTDPTDPTDPSAPSDDTTVPSECVHEYAVSAEKAATCTEKGSVTYTCGLCGDSYSEILIALGHDYSKVTCTEPKTCKLCGAISGTALGHNYNEATCIRAKTCKICGAVEGEALGHDFGDSGKCSRCGTVDPDCVHDYVTTSSKDATCTEWGYFESECSKCGEKISGEVPMIPHSYRDATCTEPKTCESCGTTEGEALGHSFAEDGNCALCGAADPSFVIEDNKDEPITIGGTLFFDAEVQSRHLVYFDLYKVSGTTLTIESANAYVIYDGVRYDAVDGVVIVPNLYSAHTNSPVSLAIGNVGEDATFAVTMSYPAGSMMNPLPFELGTVSVSTEEGNSQGIFYTFTAGADGVLTLKLDSITDGVDCKVDVFNLGSYKNEILDTTDGDADSVSIEVKSGQIVRITIGALPDVNNIYPAANIMISATLA
ncbi:MAG: hypothetical protein IJV82_01650 [Oscillospiraceae bacterium]|nr:hypothetical protein [Oscillospiraceae bacterium]